MHPSPHRLGAVASGHPATTGAGLQILRDGGNAMDALVAAALAAGICEPLLTGLGGGGLITYRDGATGEVTVLNFMSTFPGLAAGLEPREFTALRVDYGPTVQTFHCGRGSAAVPGVPLGLERAAQRFGRMDRARLAAPATALARDGWTATLGNQTVGGMLSAISALTQESAALHAPLGRPVRAGDVLRSEAQAAAMEAFGERGAAAFLGGGHGDALARSFGPPFGSLSTEDLLAFTVQEQPAIAVRCGDATLYTPPPPCLGGALLAFGLELLTSLHRDPTPANVYGAMASVMSETERARREWFDAGAREPGAVERLLGARSLHAHRRHLLQRLEQRALIPPRGPAPGSVPGNTTHISVVDAEGNAGSYTSSNGETCGTLWPGAALPVNNFLGEEDINPLGFHLGPPGQRLPTMMTPSLLVRDDGGILALGTGGANRIRTAMLQVLGHVLVGGLSLPEAVLAPRVHIEGTAVAIEDVGLPASALRAAGAPGDTLARFPERHLYFGGVHCAARHPDHRFEAVGDPRRSGCGATA